MAEPRIYKDDELPISVPPVNRAWDDMLQRLDADEQRKTSFFPKLLCTTLLLLSWLVIIESKQPFGISEQQKKNTAQTSTTLAPGSAIIPESLASTPTSQTNTKRPHQNQTLGKPGRKGKQNIATTPDQDNSSVMPDQTQTITNPITDADAGTGIKDQSRLTADSTASKKNVEKDSSSGSDTKPTEEKKTEEEKWKFQGGLHWEAQIPTTGLYGYFDGANQKAAPWRVLVPGLFMEAIQDKNALNLTVLPMYSQSVRQTPFRTENSLQQNGDTTISREEVKRLYKLLGLSASLGYARNLHEHWWGGLSLQAAWWQQGLAVSDVTDKYIVQGQTTQTKTYRYDYKVSDEWSYFSKMQMYLNADLAYRKPAWQAGVRAGVALTPLSKGEGPGHMFRGSVFLRWTPFKKSPAK